MKRFHDWPSRLAEYFRKCETQRFKYGQFDCIIFTCGAVEVMTGINPGRDFLGKYKTATGAAKQMRACWGPGIMDILQKECPAYGVRPVPVRLAKRGDIALVSQNGVAALGVVDLNAGFARVVGPDSEGVGQVEMKFVTHCWSFE